MSGIIGGAGSKSGVIGTTELEYEEGEWTGVITDGTNPMAMSYDTGYYTKVGNWVTCSGFFMTSDIQSASGGIRMTGLPFTVDSNNAARTSGSMGYGAGFAITAGHSCSIYVEKDDIVIYFVLYDATSGTSDMQASEWQDAGHTMIGFTYKAA